MKRLHILFILPVMVVLSACEAENEILSSALFDESAIGPRELVGNETVIRNGTFLLDSQILITDSGGRFGLYRNGERFVMTIKPQDPDDRVSFVLYEFESEFNGVSGSQCLTSDDYLNIYDGESVNAPRLSGRCGFYNNFYFPWTVVATNTSGALTLEWRSNSSTTFDGFYGQLFTINMFESYSISGLRTTSFGGSTYNSIYEVYGPRTLMQNHGICSSTTTTTPSRTNGASCSSASTNRYGTISWISSSVTAFTTYYVRGFLTQPNGTVIYSNTSVVIPTTKAMPDFTGFGGAPQVGDVIELDS